METTMIVPDQQFVALSPRDLPGAQRDIIGWCRAKLVALGQELKEQRQNLAESKRMLWRNQGWGRAAKKTAAKMIYYAKIKKAQAGYLIVPNFDVDLLAVRTNREKPKSESSNGYRIQADPQLLPPGQGRYVDNDVILRDESYFTGEGEKRKRIDLFLADSYDEVVDFPVALAKPVLVEATERAMSLQLFDRIGIVRKGTRSDPIVVGQICDPAVRYWRHNPKCVTFFVAWWLNTRDL